MISFRSLLLLVAAPSAAVAGDAKSPVPAPTGDWEFSLSAGPAWRQSGNLSFSGGSRSGGVSIPSFVGKNTLQEPRIGDSDTIANRTYDDGFVRRDPSTGIDGYTTNWGYQNSSQVEGDFVRFHATGFESIRSDSTTLGDSPHFDRYERSVAPVLEFSGRNKHEIYGFHPGFSASLAWSPVKLDRTWRDFSLSQVRDDFRHDWVDSYNLGGQGALIPPAPYTGSPSLPGFALVNEPDLREFTPVQIGSETAVVANSVTSRFRADHTTLSFGPTLERQIFETVSLQAGLGVSLHWLQWSFRQKETLRVTETSGTSELRSWGDSSNGNKVLAGVYLQIGAQWTPKGQDWSLKSFLKTDFGTDFSHETGPSRIAYEVDGITAAVMLSHAL